MIVLHRRGVVDEFRNGMVFQRNGLAWDGRGRQYGVNQARFETVGARRGVRIEEGTTNLLTENQSSVETDVTGFASYRGATLTRDTTVAWHGLASLKVTTPGVQSTEGVVLPSFNVAPGQTYTASVYVKGSGAVKLYLHERDSADAIIGDPVTSDPVQLTDSWQRVSVTKTFGATGTKLRFHVLAVGIAAIEFWVDGFQVEARSYATSWTLGRTTRAAEALTVPTAGILSPTQGTISLWVYVDSVARRQVANQWNRVFFVPRAGHYSQGIAVWHAPFSATWRLEIFDDAGTQLSVSVPDSHTPDGWHLFTAKWSASEAKLLIDGVVRGTIANPKLPTAFDALLWIGNASANPNSYLNAVYADLHISSIARSDEEILADFQRGYHVPDQYTTFYHPLDGPDSQRAARSVVV